MSDQNADQIEIDEDDAMFNAIADEMEGRSTQDEPEPEDDNEDEGSDLADDEPEQEAPAPVDELAATRERLVALERERDDWRHRYQSDEGRFKAAQRTLAEHHQQRAQPQHQQRADQVQTEIAKAGVEALKAGKFDEFASDFPEMAAAIEEYNQAREQQIFSKLDAELTPLKQAYEQQRQAEENAAFNRATQDLAARHPDWQQYDTNSNADFANWLEGQPAEIASMYGKPNARTASRLIDFYKLDKGMAQQQAPSQPGRAEQITKQRQAKLDRASLPATRQGATADDESEEAMWNAIAAKADRHLRR